MAEGMTINEALALQKIVRERLNILKSLAETSSKKEIWFRAEGEKHVEPKYDIDDVDSKIVVLEKWLFRADATIKQSNAVTRISLDGDVDTLLQTVKPRSSVASRVTDDEE